MLYSQMLGTPTANPAPRGSVLRKMNDTMHSAEDDFDRTPNPGELVHFMATPRKSDGERGGRGDALAQLRGYPSTHAGFLPSPAKRDQRMDKWSPAYDRRKSPSLDAVLSLTPTAKGNLTAPSMLKWAGARALAAMLQSHGLTGTAGLPVIYGWMMGFPPGWLTAAALRDK